MNYTEKSFSIYLNEIINIPSLTLEEEKRLFKAYHDGDLNAKNQLILSNLKLVLYVVNKYYHRGVSLEDLVQEGNLALQRAVETFDDTKETNRLSTYAVMIIKNHLNLVIRNQARAIRVPNNYQTKIKEFKVLYDKYYEENNRYPSLDEIAKMMNISLEASELLYRSSLDIMSLNKMVNEDKEFGELICDDKYNLEEEVLHKMDVEHIRKWLNDTPLKQRELDIIFMHYGIGQKSMTLDQIAKKYNITRAAVWSIEERALKKIKRLKYE